MEVIDKEIIDSIWAQAIPDELEQVKHAMTAKELATVLSLSPKTVFKLAKAGRIPSFRVGTSVRFDPFTISRWLRQQ